MNTTEKVKALARKIRKIQKIEREATPAPWSFVTTKPICPGWDAEGWRIAEIDGKNRLDPQLTCELRNNFPEIAQSYLELQKELERKTKALEYIELDCQKAACPLGKRLYKFVREALSPDTNDH